METNPQALLAQLRQNRNPIRNVNIEQRQKRTFLDRLAVWITNRVGTMGFFLLILVWTVGWLTWNTLAPSYLRFDPMPGFVLWLFISNLIQLLLLPLIMVGQNVQGRHSEARAEADFEINSKAEIEIQALLLLLEEQNKKLETILKNSKSE